MAGISQSLIGKYIFKATCSIAMSVECKSFIYPQQQMKGFFIGIPKPKKYHGILNPGSDDCILREGVDQR